MDDIILIKSEISREQLGEIARKRFGDMVKAVVDVEQGIMAIGGELHADEEALLLNQGSQQTNLWGINLYPGREKSDMIEFDSMINIRPSQGHVSRILRDPAIAEKITTIVNKLIQ